MIINLQMIKHLNKSKDVVLYINLPGGDFF